MNAFIYEIRNIVNNKIYIGSTKNLHKRKYKHFRDLKLNKHHSIHLQRAYNKYGNDKFVFSLIEKCNYTVRKNMEIHYMNINKSSNRKFGYNIYEPNEENFKCAKETKLKIKNSNHHLKLSRAIDMYDLLGNLIMKYDSINECARKNNIKRHLIKGIIDGKRKSYKNKTFVLKDVPFNYKLSNKQRNMSLFYK